MSATRRQRDVLQQAADRPLRRVHRTDRKVNPWPAPARVLAELVRRDLLTVTRITNRDGHQADEWTPTPEGLCALQPVRREKPVEYMNKVTGRTTTRADSVDPDAPIMDRLDPHWEQDARQRHAPARGRTTPPGNRKAA